MKKVILTRLLRIGAFFAVFALIWTGVSYLVMPRNNNLMDTRGFYSEPENTIDVFFVGNSDAYCGFSPMELWNAYGYTSYISGEPMQRVTGALNLLRDFLANQTPKLVVLETDELFADETWFKTLDATVSKYIEGNVPLIQYHDRWKRIQWNDLFSKPKYTWHCMEKGQYLSSAVQPVQQYKAMVPTEEVREIAISVRPFLDEFVNVCRENDIAVMFVQIPSATSWNYKKHNAIAAYAAENEIPFFDLNLMLDDLEFDWSKDTRDGGNHLNDSGAKKVTTYLGRYFSEHYDLENHREDPDFQLWNSDYEKYLKQTKQ